MLLGWILTTLACLASAQSPQINIGLTLNTPSTGVSTTPDGRIFLVLSHSDGSKGAQVVEYKNGDLVPYPNEEWNSYAEGKDPATHLVRVNSQRIGPDGYLWLVDTGSPSLGAPVILPAGPKMIKVDVKTNQVARIYPFGNVTLSMSFLDDIRFNPATGKAYITDAGMPAGIIVLDLATGDAKRLLNGDLSTQQYIPVSAEGNLLKTPEGKFEYIYADQLEVSPDGKYLYYQPASGGMSRIQTCYLDEALTNETLSDMLPQYVEPYAHTPSTGGTAIDAEGNIYNSDTDRLAILKIYPNGTMTKFLEDPRLEWIDAMWVDSQQRLWMPAAQLDRGTYFSNGTNRVQYPLHVYTVDIGVGPSPIDHA